MRLTLLFAGRLACALLLGAIVGLERQWRQRMAGTRTNALVAAGAAAFVLSSRSSQGISQLKEDWLRMSFRKLDFWEQE